MYRTGTSSGASRFSSPVERHPLVERSDSLRASIPLAARTPVLAMTHVFQRLCILRSFQAATASLESGSRTDYQCKGNAYPRPWPLLTSPAIDLFDHAERDLTSPEMERGRGSTRGDFNAPKSRRRQCLIAPPAMTSARHPARESRTRKNDRLRRALVGPTAELANQTGSLKTSRWR
jgi:hypothetical protein